MYRCDDHGTLTTGWCQDCESLVHCDCSDMTFTRVKDVIYDCEDGERTVTIRINHCETCGEIGNVEQY